ncbi:MAG: RNA polymerase factor sigma-54 [Saprospiraceae bacterium]|nr:RNA polymerase factor sigma-54 [Saprospiraceae bacterium]
MLKQSLSQKMLQKLSPQQIQLMKLLQIPTAILDQRIQEELEANPALEESDDREDLYESREDDPAGEDLAAGSEEDEFEADNIDEPEVFEMDEYLNDYIEDDDPASYKYRVEEGQPEEQKHVPIAVQHTLHDYLEEQLGLLNIDDERSMVIARQIIGSIDDDGYLRRDPVAIIDDLMFSQNVTASEEEVLAMLTRIQSLDPPGIGARNLQECLLIQIRQHLTAARHAATDEELDTLMIAFRILEKYFNEFTKKHYPRLQRQLNLKESQLKQAIDIILKLNPKPASGFTGGGSDHVQYIVPDFIIYNREGELDLQLNTRNAPDLRVNDHYTEMLRTFKESNQGKRIGNKEKEAFFFIKQKIDSARWFIDAIRQRQDTMFRTMYAIMNYQREYFMTGDQRKLRPMILKDVADITGLDISTVSRVANSKFVQTEFGTKRLKDFFSESLQTENGDEVSTLEVKKILTDIIASENKRKPYSDEKLKVMLRKKGYNIARRTVAKYREQLNVPVARLRKVL